MNKYIAIDLKSFYASVECIERGLDPLNTNLVVADTSRTAKTICLAATPSLKKYGISGRSRYFEVLQQVSKANRQRIHCTKNHKFVGSSIFDDELLANPDLAIDYIVAPPRMALYLDFSAKIYEIYLKHFSPEDIHIYSVDEVFIDVTKYLKTYNLSARELTRIILIEIFDTTGITATAGIGTNLYLAKVAMDIMAKKIPKDESGVIIAELDEITYRKELWNHLPITDFWRVGRGYAKRLAEHDIYTMGDIALCSITDSHHLRNEDLLYDLFGINAELLIDHAWGYEPCTMDEIKSYQPQSNSLCSSQVLHDPYSFEKARIVISEMIDQISLDLVKKNLLTDRLELTIGYDVENIHDPERAHKYKGETQVDFYGRIVPKPAHGSISFGRHTSSSFYLTKRILELFDNIANPQLLIRRMSISVGHVASVNSVQQSIQQLSFFGELPKYDNSLDDEIEKRERALQSAILKIKNRYGKNSILRGINYMEGATTKMRNQQIGGHRA